MTLTIVVFCILFLILIVMFKREEAKPVIYGCLIGGVFWVVAYLIFGY
jgi:Na+/proline symporter